MSSLQNLGDNLDKTWTVNIRQQFVEDILEFWPQITSIIIIKKLHI